MSKKQQKDKKTYDQALSVHWTTETKGFLYLLIGLGLFLSLTSLAFHPEAQNALGLMGHTIGWTFNAFFGLGSYFIAIYLCWLGWCHLFCRNFLPQWKKSYFCLAVVSLCMLLTLVESEFPSVKKTLTHFFYPGLIEKKMRYHLGGALFYYFYHDLPTYNLAQLLNTTGVLLVFSSLWLMSIFFLFKIRLAPLGHLILKGIQKTKGFVCALLKRKEIEKGQNDQPEIIQPQPESDFLRFVKLRIPETVSQDKFLLPRSDMLAIQPEKNLKSRPSLSRKESKDDPIQTIDFKEPFKQAVPQKENDPKQKRENALIAQSIYNGDFSNFVLPSPQMLSNAKKVDQTSLKKDLKKQAEVLEETLLSFGIEAKVGQINCGPTITSFEVHPAIGVKVQKIKTLDNDIALNMEAKSIRIIAPIPGKAAVGIEVPNQQPQEVGFKDMLIAYQQGSHKFQIPILLGKAVNGDYVMSDLTKMPHCIIAGATGSGKSVCINTIVMSILMNAKPDQIKMIMVDPKKVELTPYTALPHMLAPVITEPHGAAAALNWLVKEMENRYEILKLVGSRNIDAFNKRTMNQEFEASLPKEIPLFMPYIVGIIDELADLMMVASQDIETPIARIAQMARAVGIHLILATQRPSREVITGLIKANFPTRISFKVASRVNSQIVLDETGAESLLGNGDMLFLPPGSSHLIRAQGAFVRDEDIQATIQHICKQAPPHYVIQSFDQYNPEGLSDFEKDQVELDELYDQAKEVILSTGNASTTFLQRKLKVGYARAASLMDQLEMKGVVGPAEGSKPRKIFKLKDKDEDDESEEKDDSEEEAT